MSDNNQVKKEEWLEEVKLSVYMAAEGIRFDPEIFKEELKKDKNSALSHLCMDFSVDDTGIFQVPREGRLDHGIGFAFNRNHHSPFSVEKEEGKFYLKKEGKVISGIKFPKSPQFYNENTSDEVPMKTIATAGSREYNDNLILIAYSNECALRDKGKDCLFCNINATKARFGEKEGIGFKNPRQIADTVKAAYDEGYDHLTITGGFVPERRELEYYVDAAEAIRETLGRDEFNGTACIGAPADLSVIEKYKEAGFSSVAFNTEVWGEDYFDIVCPGKTSECGGFKHWIKAIEYAVEVFGRGNVRSIFVAGLQPKEVLLEGIEFLAEKGVVTIPSIWVPNVGSALEGHRTPTPEWHWDVQQKVYQILRRNGVTYQQLYNASPNITVQHSLFRIEDGIQEHFSGDE